MFRLRATQWELVVPASDGPGVGVIPVNPYTYSNRLVQAPNDAAGFKHCHIKM